MMKRTGVQTEQVWGASVLSGNRREEQQVHSMKRVNVWTQTPCTLCLSYKGHAAAAKSHPFNF